MSYQCLGLEKGTYLIADLRCIQCHVDCMQWIHRRSAVEYVTFSKHSQIARWTVVCLLLVGLKQADMMAEFCKKLSGGGSLFIVSTLLLVANIRGNFNFAASLATLGPLQHR